MGIYYGKKTFNIIKGFEFQSEFKPQGGLFACTQVDYEKYKEFLGEEYKPRPKKTKEKEIVKEPVNTVKEKVEKIVEEVKKEEVKQEEVKQEVVKKSVIKPKKGIFAKKTQKKTNKK